MTGNKEHPGDEPRLDDEEWVEYGGELIWAAGFTAGGAPYGLTLDEYRQCAVEAAPRAGWARALRILRRVFEPVAESPRSVEVGRVRYLGEGLERKAWFADVSLHPDPHGLSERYVVLLPKREVEADFAARVRREAALLARLSRLNLPFEVPRVAAVFPEQGLPVVVEVLVRGIQMDRLPSQQRKPWRVTAQLAHQIHTTDPAPLASLLGGHDTTSEHLLAEACVFEGREESEMVEAHEYVLANLPPDEPSTLIHGDLLAQNLLINPEQPAAPCTVIDWSFARRGDPAYDLAIVTRGRRRPFKQSDGAQKLVDAYRDAGGEITLSRIRAYELCLAGQWYLWSLDDKTRTEPPEQALNRLRGILKRAGAG